MRYVSVISTSAHRFEDLDAVALAEPMESMLRARHHVSIHGDGELATAEPEQNHQLRDARPCPHRSRLAVHADRERRGRVLRSVAHGEGSSRPGDRPKVSEADLGVDQRCVRLAPVLEEGE
jgi:hypothetical protein